MSADASDIAMNQLARSYSGGRVQTWGFPELVTFHPVDPDRYGICSQYNIRRCALLLHQPKVAWRAEFPDDRPARHGARWWCGRVSTAVRFETDSHAPNTVICVRCIEAYEKARYREIGNELIDMLRSGALVAPF